MRTRTKTRRLHVEILEDRCMPSTTAAFDLANPDSGPFPSDRFTVADASQLTGRRVDLPLPDRVTRPSDYDDVSVINTLDGFNLQPRLTVAFSGPINVATVNIDVRLEIQPCPGGNGHSGSPFRQAMEHAARPLASGRYVCIGAQPFAVSWEHARCMAFFDRGWLNGADWARLNRFPRFTTESGGLQKLSVRPL